VAAVVTQSPLRAASRPNGATSPPRSGTQSVVWILALALTGLAAWLVVTGWEALSGPGFSQALASGQAQMIGPALIAVVVIVFIAELRWPAVRRPVLARAHVVDAAYLGLFALAAPLVVLLNTGFAVILKRHAPFLILGRLPLVPQMLVVALIVVGMDAMNWAAHVANHRSAPLWRFHALHHSQEDMSVLTTFRTHPLSHASYVVALIPALLLQASGAVPAAAVIAYGCFVTLPHANLRWTFGPLRQIVVSPAYHRLHHARGPVAGRSAVNFGFVLVCWDRLAGCAVQPGSVPAATGLTARPVPVEQSGPVSRIPWVVAAQLTQPWRLRTALDGQP
jgi:sterol desaturase/sphingolipid hydroxylase (fatty acid hydroxylase superfamily)